MAEQVRLCHDRDGHPSKNKHREIIQARKGHGYPPNFLLLDYLKCETCTVTAGARKYRITRVRTHAVKASPFAGPGEQARVQEKESAKTPPQHLSLKDHRYFKHGRDVPVEAQLQYLKPGIFAQALVHNKFVFTLPKDVRGDETDLRVMASHAYSYKKFWYVDCEIVSPKVPNNPKLIQMPVVRGDSSTTKHKHNLRDLFNRIYVILPRWQISALTMHALRRP